MFTFFSPDTSSDVYLGFEKIIEEGQEDLGLYFEAT